MRRSTEENGQTRRLLAIVTVVLTFCVMALFSAVLTMRFAIHGAQTTMPDLRGMTEAAATARASGQDLTLRVDGRFYSETMLAGKVLTQFPIAGTAVRRGSRVQVTESLGAQRSAVPRLVGLEERVAALEVRRAGLALGIMAHMPYAAPAPDTVVAQSPSADAAKIEQPEISILVSLPVPVEGKAYVMPDLAGQNARAAAATLAHAGIKVDPFILRDPAIPEISAQPGQAPLLPVLPGTVLAQHPEPGERITETSSVVLTVAR